MPNELKPCPFCDGEAFSYAIEPHKHSLWNIPDHNGSGYVECSGCSASVAEDTEEKAKELWNRRADNG